MFKKVNIKPQSPIFTLKVPITAPVMGITMSTGDIAMCIHARALVSEILPNGKIVKLNLSNFDKDNSIVIDKEELVELPGIEDVIEGVKVDAEPVIIAKEEVKVKVAENAIKSVTEGVKEDAEPVVIAKEEVKENTDSVKEVINQEKVEIEIKEDAISDDVKSIDGDPKYFKEVERQKNKVKKNK